MPRRDVRRDASVDVVRLHSFTMTLLRQL
jgi:hypothetical protein